MTRPPQQDPQEVRRAIAAARMELAAAEDENRRLHAELSLMERSTGLRVLVRAREAAGDVALRIRHPLWSAGTLARRVIALRPVDAAARSAAHLLRRSHPLRLLAPVRSWTDRGSATEAVRWIGPLTIRHTGRQALFCHPNSGIEYRLTAMPGSSFVTAVGLSPIIWRERPPAVTFHIEMRSVANDWTRTAQLVVDVARKATDRRWHTLRIAVPPDVDRYGQDVVVILSTATAAATVTDNAWAVFGEPRLERRRPSSEVKRSVGAFMSRVRQAGLRSALRVAHDASAGQDAERYARWCASTAPAPADLERMAQEATRLTVSATHRYRHPGLQHGPEVAARLHRVGPWTDLRALAPVSG